MKFQTPSDENETVAKSLGWFWTGTGVVVIIVLLAVGIGYLSKYYVSGIKYYGGTTPMPTANPVVEEKKEFTLEVWNGSGVAGAAAKEAERIKKLGIKVIGVDSADEKIKGNQLLVRKGYEEEAKKLLKKLRVEEITGVLQEGTAAARLVLGR